MSTKLSLGPILILNVAGLVLAIAHHLSMLFIFIHSFSILVSLLILYQNFLFRKSQKQEDSFSTNSTIDLIFQDQTELIQESVKNTQNQFQDIISKLELEHIISKALINTVQDPLFAINTKEEIILHNIAFSKHFSDSKELTTGKKLIEVIRHLGIQNQIDLALRGNIETRPSQIEINSTYYQFTTYLTKDKNGSIIGLVCHLQNINERQLVSEMKEDFIANVSHELRTPLTSLQNNLFQLNHSIENPSILTDEILKRLEKNVQNMIQLFDDILELSKIENLNQIKMESFSAEDFALSCLEQLRSELGKEVESTALTYHTPQLIADWALLHLAVTNILSNAYKYNKKESSQVSLIFSETNTDFKIDIVDNGIGIPQEHYKRIFERFYRINDPSLSKQNGTGIGLALAKHAVSQMKGKIQVESIINKGSTFTIIIPKKLDQA